MLMRRRHAILTALLTIAVLLYALLVSSGCIFGGEGDRDLSEFFDAAEEPAAAEEIESQAEPDESGLGPVDVAPPPEKDLLDLSEPPLTALEAVQKFFALVAAERFEDAYRLASLEARELTTAEEFAERYRDIWEEATIRGVRWEVVPPPGENVAGIEVVLSYDTVFFGEIEERVFAPTRRQPGWVVDWSPDLIFAGLGERGYLVHRFLDVPERGEIFDRNGEPLATQGEIIVIGISHELISDEDAVIDLFVERLELDDQAVRDLMFQNMPSYFFIPIVRLPYDVDPALVESFEQLADLGVLVRRETQRTYPQSELAAHVVGFMAEINEEELETLAIEGYQSGDMVGRDGVEAIFEQELAGKRGGRLTIISPDGQVVREIAAQALLPSRDVYLTLDTRIQRVAEAALGEETGAVVVMDPRTKELLALASYPRFDPNAFIRGLTQEEFALYFEDERQPFVNRTAERLYPPGSIFKVVTLAAGLEAGGFDEQARLDCPAAWRGLGDETPLKNWQEEDRGLLSLTQALAESCNTVFYQVGQELHRRDENALTQFSAGFGFGEETGAIGVHEEAGVNPGPEWKRINRNDFWYTGDTVNMSIGQGFLLTTPLQITNAYAALATDGLLRTPLAVHSLRTPEGEIVEQFSATPIGVLPISAATHAYLRNATRQVVLNGTGWTAFRDTPLAAAGKSGTAEDRDEQNHVLFVAYANVSNPRLVATVVLDNGESGAKEAGPIVRNVLERSLLSGWVP